MEEGPVSVPLLILQSLKDLVFEISPLSILALVVSICIINRIVTGIAYYFPVTHSDGTTSVRAAPYWIPYFGHVFSLGFERWRLFQTAARAGEPIIGVPIRGKSHNVIASRSLVPVVREKSSSLSSEAPTTFILENAFGASKNVRNFNRGDLRTLSGPVRFLNEDPWLTDISSTLVREVQQAMPNLVSFSSSVVDQSTWERMSGVSVSGDGPLVCEVNLFSLVRNFVGSVSTTLLMGRAFSDTFPYALNELWSFDNHFDATLLGIPRWVPFPGLVTSYAARRRLLLSLKAFHKAFAAIEIGVEPEFEFQDLDDVSEIVKARMRALIDGGYTPEQAASEHLAFLWAQNMTTNTIIFWNLVHILSDTQLYQKIMQEIKTSSSAVRPDGRESGFNMPEPARLRLDFDSLVAACPLLKASYYETLRVYSTPLSYQKATKNINLTPPDTASTTNTDTVYKCDVDSYIVIPYYAHNKNPDSFPEPDKFRPERFLPQDSKEGIDAFEMSEIEKLIADEMVSQQMNDVWPSDSFTLWSYSREFAERQALIFTAAFLLMWDIKRADGKPWAVPDHKHGSATCVPKRDIRVKIRSRV